jgi:desulfoferrodoxin-like iron-binding protein
MANQIGKIYLCGQCGSQFIVTKGGTGSLECCGKPMEQKK